MKLTSKILICRACNKEFHTTKSRENTSKYCSSKCSYTRMFGNKYSLGFKHSEKYKMNLSKIRKGKINIGIKNGQWKGDKVGYSSLHEWVRKYFGKPLKCMYCNKNKPFDLANISGKYKREFSDWEWLCRRCHMTKDGRMKNLLVGMNKQ